jgi:hypothetical protein
MQKRGIENKKKPIQFNIITQTLCRVSYLYAQEPDGASVTGACKQIQEVAKILGRDNFIQTFVHLPTGATA